MVEKCVYKSDSVLKEVFRLPKWLGAFPYNTDLERTPGTVLWAVSCVVFTSYVSSIPIIHYHAQPRRTVKIIAANTNNIVSLLALLKNGQAVRSLRDSLRSIETSLRFDGITWRWEKRFIYYFRYHLCFAATLLFSVATRYRSLPYWAIVSEITSYIGPFPILVTIIGQFTGLLAVFSSLLDSVVLVKEPCSLVRAYYALHTASDSVQRIYGLQLLLYSTCTFTFAVCNIYYEIVFDYGLGVLLGHMMWTSLFFIALMEIVTACNRTAAKARKINELLYERMMEDTSDTLVNNDLLEFHITCSRELVFTACGFFNLDNSLIYSMIACATTYLVILLQYTQPTTVNVTSSQCNETTA